MTDGCRCRLGVPSRVLGMSSALPSILHRTDIAPVVHKSRIPHQSAAPSFSAKCLVRIAGANVRFPPSASDKQTDGKPPNPVGRSQVLQQRPLLVRLANSLSDRDWAPSGHRLGKAHLDILGANRQAAKQPSFDESKTFKRAPSGKHEIFSIRPSFILTR